MSLDKFIPKKTSRKVQQPLRKKLAYLQGATQRGKKRGRKR